MFPLFRNSIFKRYCLLFSLFGAAFALNFFSIGIVSDTLAQTRDQKELAQSLGFDIDDLKGGFEDKETGIGREMEDFTIELPDKKDKEDLRTYLGFRGDLSRFGEELFSSERGEFKIADDAQAPDDYLLGLGDQIIIQYYGAESVSYTIEIDRNGSILLPKVGPINLNGLKLYEAQELIRNRVNSQLVGVNATVTIGKTKFINIFIAGNVEAPGVYSMPALSRVTHALYLAGGITELGTYRNIQVKRGGKLVGKVDLYDFLINGDNSSDINLRSNDVILVGESNKNLQITGAVKRPGIFELKGGDDAKAIISYAGGMAPGADIEAVIYSSLISDSPNKILNFSQNEKFSFFDGDAIHFNFKATSYTKVNKSNYVMNKASAIRVNIQGEVNYPGTYLMAAGERISDLMARAGGPTEASFLHGAVFTREKVRQREAFRARELAEEVRRQVVSSSQTQSTNQLDVEDVEFITEQLETYSGIGRVIIDLPRALAGRNDANLVLSDGDALYIPERSNTITVFGEVRRQSSYVYNSQFEIEDYLTLAAGITQLADEDNIYIVKANGNVAQPKGGWFRYGSDKLLSEGDTIIVPVDYDYRQSLPFWRDVISIVYQGAVAIAAISGL
ncbi:iron complex transport system ATP-binding protein [Candidatus Micropelagos thuwalensis]|uniref:Iron complex transport system ATP-binding protein n=1 Tax=Candidatus Micropelagius thuwalensis TaxID=1397666 RepID=U2WTQ3_9PROT|nr:iron complex transport system ATP-binding protein [Candidatus Micropelagos thuwalensis]